MSQHTSHTANQNALPHAINDAMREMISVSQKLVTIAETEAQKLIQNDWLGFTSLQDEKENIAEHYVRMSREFRTRLNDFRRVDQSLLGNLETVQNTLATKTKSNSIMINRMKTKAQSNTQSTLLTAQEYAGRKSTNTVLPFETDHRAENANMARNSQDTVQN